MAFNPLEKILAADDSRRVVVPCEPWGVFVECSSPIGTRKAIFDDFVRDNRREDGNVDPIEWRAIVLCVVISGAKEIGNEAAEFQPWDLEFAEAKQIVEAKNNEVVEQIFNAGVKMLGLNERERDELEKK